MVQLHLCPSPGLVSQVLLAFHKVHQHHSNKIPLLIKLVGVGFLSLITKRSLIHRKKDNSFIPLWVYNPSKQKQMTIMDSEKWQNRDMHGLLGHKVRTGQSPCLCFSVFICPSFQNGKSNQSNGVMPKFTSKTMSNVGQQYQKSRIRHTNLGHSTYSSQLKLSKWESFLKQEGWSEMMMMMMAVTRTTRKTTRSPTATRIRTCQALCECFTWLFSHLILRTTLQGRYSTSSLTQCHWQGLQP